jgi:hypothetical protein
LFSNLKLGVYEFLGLVVPGMFVLCEGWILVRGWGDFAHSVNDLHPIPFTMFVATAFVLGHFVQELADWSVKKICGERFLKAGRDELWAGKEAEAIKSSIWSESGITLPDVDAAFDYCLTRLGQSFSKRDVFLATSDFSRSFLVLVAFGIAPAARLARDRSHSWRSFALLLVGYGAFLSLIGALAWARMLRFRRISDEGVFRAYLGSRPPRNSAEKELTDYL